MEFINIQILTYIYKKEHTFKEIQNKFNLETEALNQLLAYPEMKGMYSASTTDYRTAKYKTTFSGQTIAVSEIHRRREVIFTRILSVISLITSVIAIWISK